MGTKVDREIQSKLRTLKKDIDRNEERMRKAAIDYENLIAEKESLSAAVADLKRTQAERRQQVSQKAPGSLLAANGNR